jgi:tRNA G18 (ribose-2'-O)-methylase SpoU
MTATLEASGTRPRRRAFASERVGWFGIGIYHPKREINVGTLYRSAAVLGAAYTFQIGGRFAPQCADTTKAWRKMPHFTYADADAFFASTAYSTPIVAVELDDTAAPLAKFHHPERAVYLLGAEDFGIPSAVIGRCQQRVVLPGDVSVNVAVAGSIVMYDRVSKVSRWHR